jgi:micrococcal nuclease
MAALSEFEHGYTRQTLEMVGQSGAGPFEVPSVINSLLGLLIVPRHSVLAGLPEVAFASLRSWGIGRDSIRRFNGPLKGAARAERGPTLRQLVERLRLAVARRKVVPRFANHRFTGLEFRDGSFHAVLTMLELKRFVRKLAQYLGGYCDLDAADTRFVASWARKPFHRTGCKWARRIQRRNLTGVRSRGIAVRAGHRPCKVCRP